jgi:hypothetical protein
MQLYTSVRDYKDVGNFPGSHSVAFLISSAASKRAVLSVPISMEETGKNHLEPGYRGCSSFVTLFFSMESLTKTDRCAVALS